MSRRLRLSALALAAVLGCAHPSPKLPAGPITAVEITQDGEELPIPSTGLCAIDENSTIKLKVNMADVHAALQSAASIDSEKLKAIGNRIAKVRAAQSSQQAALTALESVINSPPTPARVESVRATLHRLEKTAFDDMRGIATSVDSVEWRATMNDALAKGVRASYGASIDALRGKNDELDHDIGELLRPLERVRWRMRASIHGRAGHQDLHLDGYDRLNVGEPNIINKLAIPKDLMTKLDDARAAAAELGNLQNTLTRARDVLRRRAEDLRDRALKLAEGLQLLTTIADRTKDAPWATLSSAKAVVTDCRRIASDAALIVKECRPAFEALRGVGASQASTVLDWAQSMSSPLGQCIATVGAKGPAVVNQSKQLLTDLVALGVAFRADAHLAKSVVAEAESDLSYIEGSVVATTIEDFNRWWSSFAAVFEHGPTIGSGPVQVSSEHLVDRTYAEVADTAIDLVRVPRAPGDVVYYSGAVVSDGVETKQWTSAPMRVVVTGWHVDVSASVVFVRALRVDAQDSAFPAAPAATASIHYGARRGANENRGNAFWNFLDPGIGLHVAYLDLGPKTVPGSTSPVSNPASEVGIGGTLQLFGDVLQAGLAYDLQVQRAYGFFGVGLQTATNFGLTVPSGQ